MDDWEVIKSAEAILQTYDTTGGRALYRTALILRQDPDRPIVVEDRQPPFGLFLVEVGREDSAQPNSLELHGHEDVDVARREAVQWLGAERTVKAQQVPTTVLGGVANVIRDPTLVREYAP